MMSINYWRLIGEDYDGHAHSQCLICYERIYAPYQSIQHWKYCPECGTQWKGELNCRQNHVPRYEYDHPEIDWNSIPLKRVSDEHIRYYIQKRYKIHNKYTEWSNIGYIIDPKKLSSELERCKAISYKEYGSSDEEYRVIINPNYIIK